MPPAGFRSDAAGPDASAEEILAGGVRESDWSFPVLLSTPDIDREGDSLIPEGCDYQAFAASPIVFFDHQEIRFPVGRMRGPDGRLYFAIIPGKGILGRIWIRQPQEGDPASYAEACQTVWILVRDGLLNGISAGFKPIGPVKRLKNGGNLYSKWELLESSIVPVAANCKSAVIRDIAPWDDAILKRFSPSVIKGLRSMSRTKEHHDTHDIKYRNGEWVILDNSTRKVLSRHKTRKEALAALRGLEYGKHESKSKSMTESSGDSGGYLVPEEHAKIAKQVRERMSDHGGKGHACFFHAGNGGLRHFYPHDDDDEKIKSMGADLSDIPGVNAVTQLPQGEGDAGEGYQQIYPAPKKNKHLVARQLRRAGRDVYQLIRKKRLNGWVARGLELRVRRIVPKLLRCEIAEDKAIAMAYGLAAIHKGLLPLVSKSAGSDDDDENQDDEDQALDDAAANSIEDDGEDETSPGPDGLELVQTAIENLESALPRLEPERRAFWEGIIDQIKDHGEETYPGEDFDGEDDDGAEAQADGDNDADEQQLTNEMLARYKGTRQRCVKRISVTRKLKSMNRHPESLEAIRKAANHLHEIGDMDSDFDDHGAHVKGYTPAHQRHCRIRARELDRLHGALSKPSEPAPEPAGDESAEDDSYLNDLMPHLKGLEAKIDGFSSITKDLHLRANGR